MKGWWKSAIAKANQPLPPPTIPTAVAVLESECHKARIHLRLTGICSCGKKAFRKKRGEWICLRCDDAEHQNHKSHYTHYEGRLKRNKG